MPTGRHRGPPAWLLVLVLLKLVAVPLALLTPLPLTIAVDSALGDEPLPGFAAAVVPDRVERSDRGVPLLAWVF
ncbi:MAG: hypothetical protein M3O70_00490 [Actinomycetota bacterium]|nr:hypothetical protein [Actinomycetota bacterium]